MSDPEPPFVDPWPVTRVAREFPFTVSVACDYCGAPVGASCVDQARNGLARHHPARVELLLRKRDRERYDAHRIALEYPARPPHYPPRPDHPEYDSPDEW